MSKVALEASPQSILEIFNKLPKRPVSFREVMEKLGSPYSHRLMILHMMRAMAQDGSLVRLRNKHFMLPEPARAAEGILHVSLKGTGFLIGAASDGEDLYVHRSNLGSAVDGDTVEAEIFTGPKGNDEGRVVRVIERGHPVIVGEFFRQGKGGTVTPRNVRLLRWIEVPDAPPAAKLPNGAWVAVQIKRWSDGPEEPLLGEIKEVLGKAGERGVSILVLLRDQGVDLEFAPEVIREANRFHAISASSKNLADRLDLRDARIFTIDPATAKDFDDAISIEKNRSGNWVLGVHIADVSEYVHPDSALDKEALKRGTSIYPVDRVVPMLPERLSGDLCSLRPEELRFAMSVFMEFTPDGEEISHRMAESIIRSSHRMNYDEVQEFFDHPEDRGSFHFADFADDLLASRELARILTARRMARGSLDLDLPESEIECNIEGDTIAIHRRERHESHRLIEEFMIAANEAVGRYIRELKLPMLYRIHDIPNPSALQKLAPMLGMFGVRVPKKVIPSPEFYQPIVERLRRMDGGHIAQRMLLRTLMRAEYSPENRGHFGLASKCYCHFTSPIRRYPDLIVHRIMKAHLRGQVGNGEWQDQLAQSLPSIANQSNTMADRAMRIELDAERIKAMELMSDNIGGVFEAWVSGIVRSGFFAELVDMPVEGFVNSDTIPGDRFAPDEQGIRLVGQYTRRTFALGHRVRVRVVRVSQIDGDMDLEIVDKAPEKGKKKGRGKKS